MEVTVYLGIALLSIFFSVRRSVITNKFIFFTFWSVIYIALVLAVRETFDADIKNYAKSMSYTSMALYFIKEPVVWFGQRYLFYWFQNAYLVFIVTDLLVGFLLFRALENFKLPQFAFFSILIFFPFILGMQNIYRQWVATILFLYCFSFIWNHSGRIKRYVTFTLSVMSHNVSAIFVPLLFVKKSKFLDKLSWYGSLFIAFAGIYFGADMKSSGETGSDLTLAYTSLLAFFVMLFPLIDKGAILKKRTPEYKLLLFLFFLSGFSLIILSSAGAERVSMFCLMLAYPILVLQLDESFKQKVLLRSFFSLMGFIPILLFGASTFILGT